jgi:hypothetical protein
MLISQKSTLTEKKQQTIYQASDAPNNGHPWSPFFTGIPAAETRSKSSFE